MWKNIKIYILKKQSVLLELGYRFGFKHIIFKKAQMRLLTRFPIRLWATKIAYEKINFAIFKLHRYLLIQEKIQVVKKLTNVLAIKFRTKQNWRVLKIVDEAVQSLFYLTHLVLIPCVGFWKKNLLKKVLKRLKTNLFLNKKINKFHFSNYFAVSINKSFFHIWVLTMLLKKWCINYKHSFKTPMLFLFFDFILNKFENVVWKNLLLVATKKIFIKNKIFLFKNSLQFKNLISKIGYLKFLKIAFIYSFNSVNIFCNNFFFMHNFILTKISNFCRKKGIYIVLKKSKTNVLTVKTLNFFEWVYDKSLIIFRLSKNKLFLFKNQLKQFFFKKVSLSSYKLIVQLNSIIKNWLNIFKLSSCYHVLRCLGKYLFKLCWKWASRKYFKWSMSLIWRFYFKYNNKFLLSKNRFFGISFFKSNNLKLKKKFIYVMYFKNLILLN